MASGPGPGASSGSDVLDPPSDTVSISPPNGAQIWAGTVLPGMRQGNRRAGLREEDWGGLAGQRRGRHPIPQGTTSASAPTGLGTRSPRMAGRAAQAPRPPAWGGVDRGARLRSPAGVQALADSALSRPERKTAVTVTR